MRVAFFHGLESPAVSDKTVALEKLFDYVYDPAMDYKDQGLFNTVLNEVKKQKIDLLIGSSMGGWFAYCISTLTGIPTLLFNPAVQGRSFDPNVMRGSTNARHTIVFGKSDDLIDPKKSLNWFKSNGVGSFDYNYESNGHRTPIGIFKKWINAMNKPILESSIPSFEVWTLLNEMNEMSIPSGKWVDMDLSRIDKEGMDNIWKMYSDTYGKAGMDFSANDANELKTKYKATCLKDIDNDNIADAFIIYKETAYGNKIALLGTNDKKEAKRDLIKKVIDLLNTKGWFIEASLKMEEILSSSKVPVIDDEKVIMDIVGKDKKPEMGKNGYYTRFLSKASKRIEKRMYGSTKN
jgi:hypothetical protein